ncbi:galactoside O-acetyltransferase [Rhodoferax koreense]|uniref:Galactoside O-acetyltransferase n=1 Tax=Rhodoferax koreensis TaxID=1842727 RepID=A0A1P8JS23_9BURK|nr:acyltransferase [Rhodoferax koreense]APW36531.1 galactoside O-acetyltransferase [Rhodoferax koreense]
MALFYSPAELAQMGFLSVGNAVRLSRKASVHGASRIALGDHVRIDDFCVLSAGAGGIAIGNHIHVAVFSSIIGAGRVQLDDFSNISSRVSIYSSSDDYSGEAMTNPTVPTEWTRVDSAPVHVGRHAIIGAGSVLLPGVHLGEGAAVGALSLVKSDCEAFGIYAGSPARRVGTRKKTLLDLERQFLAQRAHADAQP